jgi:hypothetical protein
MTAHVQHRIFKLAPERYLSLSGRSVFFGDIENRALDESLSTAKKARDRVQDSLK